MKLDPGTEVSHYKILSEIGKGGMGTVYLAHDTKLERKVAIKFLSKEWSDDKDKLKRFQQEAKAASALNHPNILTIYEIDQVDGVPYISAEFINGTDVSSYVSEEKISLIRVLDITMQIATALSTAHEAGIVHRDIKPDNVMIRDDGIVKILDFGLAKLTEKAQTANEKLRGQESETLITGSAGSPKTLPGIVMGTANYMSPEQARGKDVDQRSDIFSFGALLYEMLTRKRPFDGETTSDVIAAVLTKNPPPVRKLNKGIPKALSKIVERSLQKDRKKRFQSISELIGQLEALIRDLQIDEIEKTILPEDENGKTKILKTATGEEANQTTAAPAAGTKSNAMFNSPFGKIAAAFALLVVFGGIGFVAWSYFGGGPDQIDSIAVMPFVNESGNQDIEYLADGMTENLISSLAKIPDLSVKARSSVFRYKGKPIDSKIVGDELNVKAVLLGHVVQRGEELTLNLELVEARTENVVWTEKFTRKMENLVSLQTDIARDVAEKLRITLSTADRENLTKSYTASSEAQQLYLKGRFHWNKRNTKDFEKAASFFTEAIEKDPKYALAYSGLADTYALMPLYGAFRPKDYMPKAKTAALKAIELDGNLAEAHASLGQILAYYDYDQDRAETEFKRALELDPSYAAAHLWYGELLAAKGENEKAIAEIGKALELEPFSLVFNRMYGVGLFWDRKYDQAIQQLKKTIELFPNDATSKQNLGDVYAAKKMYAEAINTYSDAARTKGVPTEMIDELRKNFEKGGWEAFQRSIIELLNERKKKEFVPNFDFAIIYANLGEKEKALEYLEMGLEEREDQLLLTINDANFDFIREHPRFKELISKIGSPK